MHRALHGALMGLLIGGPSTLLAYFMVRSVVDKGMWPIVLWIICWVAWGAVLGMILPKHK
jgi:hypothetical protein